MTTCTLCHQPVIVGYLTVNGKREQRLLAPREACITYVVFDDAMALADETPDGVELRRADTHVPHALVCRGKQRKQKGA